MSCSLFDCAIYLVWLQWYEETYLAAGGFRKVTPEELHDREDDGDSNDDDDDIQGDPKRLSQVICF